MSASTEGRWSSVSVRSSLLYPALQEAELQGVSEVLSERPSVLQLDLEHSQPRSALHLLPQLRGGPGEGLGPGVWRGLGPEMLSRRLSAACQDSGLEYFTFYLLTINMYSTVLLDEIQILRH